MQVANLPSESCEAVQRKLQNCLKTIVKLWIESCKLANEWHKSLQGRLWNCQKKFAKSVKRKLENWLKTITKPEQNRKSNCKLTNEIEGGLVLAKGVADETPVMSEVPAPLHLYGEYWLPQTRLLQEEHARNVREPPARLGYRDDCDGEGVDNDGNQW